MKAITFPTFVTALAAASAALIFAPAGHAAGGSFGHFGGGAAHVSMPSGGFHGAPGYHGPSPRAAPPLGAIRPGAAGPSRVPEHFSGRGFDHFSPTERARWSGGGWRHGWRGGRRGWWWVVGDDWFYYDEPSYPYPTYVGAEDAYDPSEDGAYCEDPPGYYPDVTQCNVDWAPAPER